MIKMSQDNFTETYLNLLNNQNSENNIISEEFHRAPILGWNKDYFAKVMVKMLRRAIEKYATKEIDDFFLSKKLFSFEKVFKEKPSVETGGSGRTFSATIKYKAKIDSKESELLLKGKDFGKVAKFFKIDKNNRGILWNNKFLSIFEAKIGKNDESEEDMEELESESVKINNELMDIYLNSIITEASEEDSGFTDDDVKKFELNGIGVEFVFNKVKYCDNIKKRSDYINANRVNGMTR